MMIQVNSDKQIVVDRQLFGFVRAELASALSKFERRLTRVEVHLSDLNSRKPGPRDKRCQLEARPKGKKPVSVSEEAATVEQAVRGAAGKMRRLLATSFGRTRDRRISHAA